MFKDFQLYAFYADGQQTKEERNKLSAVCFSPPFLSTIITTTPQALELDFLEMITTQESERVRKASMKAKRTFAEAYKGWQILETVIGNENTLSLHARTPSMSLTWNGRVCNQKVSMNRDRVADIRRGVCLGAILIHHRDTAIESVTLTGLDKEKLKRVQIIHL